MAADVRLECCRFVPGHQPSARYVPAEGDCAKAALLGEELFRLTKLSGAAPKTWQYIAADPPSTAFRAPVSPFRFRSAGLYSLAALNRSPLDSHLAHDIYLLS
jgi:hypothetical protein